jgi:hypothetical protein
MGLRGHLQRVLQNVNQSFYLIQVGLVEGSFQYLIFHRYFGLALT